MDIEELKQLLKENLQISGFENNESIDITITFDGEEICSTSIWK